LTLPSVTETAGRRKCSSAASAANLQGKKEREENGQSQKTNKLTSMRQSGFQHHPKLAIEQKSTTLWSQPKRTEIQYRLPQTLAKFAQQPDKWKQIL
jgi:hypothetical protein